MRPVDSNSLSEPALLILLSLAPQPRHGFGILTDIEELSLGRVKLSTGTLYGALRRMQEDQWIERFHEPEAAYGRQSYRLSSGGHRVLAAEVSRIEQVTRAASTRLAAEKY